MVLLSVLAVEEEEEEEEEEEKEEDAREIRWSLCKAATGAT